MTLRVVVDSCVSLKWFIPEPEAALAERLLAPDVEVFAPDVTLVEIANALWKNERLMRISKSIGEAALATAPRYYQELLQSADLLAEALELGRSIDHPIYDCLYVVASRRTGAELVTTDQKLLAKLAGGPDARNALDLVAWTRRVGPAPM